MMEFGSALSNLVLYSIFDELLSKYITYNFSITEITDSLVIGPTILGEVKILLFVILRQDQRLNNNLIDKIRTELKQKASPRHVPEKIFQVKEIPYTLNMKKVELAVRNIFENRPVTNRDSLSNPECLDEYMAFAKEYLNQT